MKNFYAINIILSFVVLLLWYSRCAVIEPITGGEKDSLPPLLKKASPQQYSVNVPQNKRRYTLKFSENINLTNPNENIYFQPSLEKELDIFFNAKFVTLRVKDTLRRNTTYNVHFNNAVGDLNENNTLENFIYHFSTSDYFDSFYLEGYVFDTKGMVPDSPMTVGLYFYDNVIDDSIFFTKQPDYRCNTTSEGKFRFDQLASGEYMVVALNDIDNNQYYSNKKERVAFMTKKISIPYFDKYEHVEEYFRRVDKSSFDALEKDTEYDQNPESYIINLNKFLDSINKINQQKKEDDLEKLEEQDSILRFSETPFFDIIKDSSNVVLYSFVVEKDAELDEQRDEQQSFYNIEFDGKNQILEHKFLTIDFPKIDYFPTRNIVLMENDQKVLLTSKNFISNENQLIVKYPLDPNNNYSLFIDTIVSSEVFTKVQKSYDTTTFEVITKDDLYDIFVYVTNYSKKAKNNFVLRLLKDGKLISSKAINTDTIKFTNLYANDYQFDMLVDFIPNLKYDTGSYTDRILPEFLFDIKTKISGSEFTNLAENNKNTQEEDGDNVPNSMTKDDENDIDDENNIGDENNIPNLMTNDGEDDSVVEGNTEPQSPQKQKVVLHKEITIPSELFYIE